MERAERDALFATLDASDFRGETAFRDLTIEQRLAWLARAAAFAIEMRRERETADARNEKVPR